MIEEQLKEIATALTRIADALDKTPTPPVTGSPVVEEQPVDRTTVIKAITELRDTKGNKAAKDVLNKINRTKLSEIEEEDYPQIMRYIQEAA